MNAMLQAALDYAEAGLPIFPCKPDKTPYPAADHDANGNKIAKTGGLYKATTDEATIRDWWREWPNAMVGLRMGKASGLFAIDPDAPKQPGEVDGRAELAKLEERHGYLNTLTTNTPGAGNHKYFTWREDRPVGNGEGDLRGLGINVRGEGGYVIVPPSVRDDGRAYEYDRSAQFVADAPGWLYDLILPTKAPPLLARTDEAQPTIRQQALDNVFQLHTTGRDERPYCEKTLRRECDALAATRRPGRNAALNTAALKLGQLVGPGRLDEREVWSGLEQATIANGLMADGRQAVVATIKSGLYDGMKQPRVIPERQAAPERQPEPLPAGPLIVSSAAFLDGFIPPDYLIDGILQRRFIYSLTAPTGSGKTAIALMLAVHVAEGRAIGEMFVEQGRVLYLAGENPDDIRMRWLAAAEKLNFDAAKIDVHFLPGTVKLSAVAARIRKEVEAIGPVSLVIIDTSAAYFEGDDENGNVQMGNHARLLRDLVKLPGEPCVLVACHPVKNASGESMLLPRGGGAFIAEMDGNLTCCKEESTVKLHWTGKFRGPDFAPMHFGLHSATADALKDSRGRSIPTVVAMPISEDEQQEREAGARSDEDALLMLMADGHTRSQAEVATALFWLTKKGKPDRSKAQRAIERLRRSKLAEASRRGLVLTPKGHKEAERIGGKPAASNHRNSAMQGAKF